MQTLAKNASYIDVPNKVGGKMTYLVLSNLILILVPLALLLLRNSSKYSSTMDFYFSLLTFGIVVFGFIPEHFHSMTLNDLLTVVIVMLGLELLERLSAIEQFAGPDKSGRIYFR